MGYYSHLPPGDYRFRVTACDKNGIWNESGAALALTILPHFWQTWWFRFAVIGLLGSLVLGAHKLRLALERRLNHLQLRIASDLHDEVGSNLGSIALLCEVNARRDAETAGGFNEIRQIAAQTVESLRDIVWFLDPARTHISDIVRRMKEVPRIVLPGQAVEFHSDGAHPSAVPSLEFRRNIFPMFKEMLYNIARHARASRVQIQIHITPRQFELWR